MHFPFSQQEIERKVNCSLWKGNVLIFLWVKCSAPFGHTCRWRHQTLSFSVLSSPLVLLGLSAWFFMTSLKTWLCQACCRFIVILPFSTGCWNDFFRQFKQFFCTFLYFHLILILDWVPDPTSISSIFSQLFFPHMLQWAPIVQLAGLDLEAEGRCSQECPTHPQLHKQLFMGYFQLPHKHGVLCRSFGLVCS